MTERKFFTHTFATYKAEPALGGVAWTTFYHCPVEGCRNEATVDCTSRRHVRRLCTKCARTFARKPGKMRFGAESDLAHVQVEMMRARVNAQVNDALQNTLAAAKSRGSAWVHKKESAHIVVDFVTIHGEENEKTEP